MAAIEAIANRQKAEPGVEVATFYTMFNLKPVGKYFCRPVQLRRWLRGSDEMIRCIKDRYNIASGQTSACGRFSLLEVECLALCKCADFAGE